MEPVIDMTAIRAAARKLEQGGLVAFPTETVYGLGADAENPAAIAALYAAKGRPADHPVIVHLAPEAPLASWAAELPEEAHKLVAAFWPGPLTLIVKRAPQVPDLVSGGQDTIGLRCPAHPVAQALLREFKQGRGGVAAPSANRFGRVSPTTAQHVRDEFPAAVLDCILDGGQSAVGIESTILDLSRIDSLGPVLLRPGHISADQIAQVIGPVRNAADIAAPRVSGSLASHYAPVTPVVLVAAAQVPDLLRRLLDAGKRSAWIRHTDPGLPEHALIAAQVRLPATPSGYAHGLYDALRTLDTLGADLILVEAPPATPPWQGVNDRLRRASHDSAGVLARMLAPS